jgi:hypothetical protein
MVRERLRVPNVPLRQTEQLARRASASDAAVPPTLRLHDGSRAPPRRVLLVPGGVEHTALITGPLRGLLIYSPGDAEHITQPV